MSQSKGAISLIDIRPPERSVEDEIKEAIMRVYDRAAFIGGKPVDDFAAAFGSYCGASCAPVANGTDALIVALRALGVGKGDEVITVPFTFIATAEAIGAVGAEIRFVDVDARTFTLDPALLEAALTPRTKAIIPVHLFGQPCDMDSINDIAKKHGCFVIEDAAQAHGARYRGRRTGGLGDAACFSFYPTKNLGAFGDAGAVVSTSKDLIERVNQIANHGRAEQYLHAVEGLNSRMDAMQAAGLAVKLRYLDRWNARRREIAARYDEALRGRSDMIAPHVAAYTEHVYHLYTVVSDRRDDLLAHLRARGVGAGVYYPLPLHRQPAYASLGFEAGRFPVSEALAARVLSIACHPNMSDADIDHACDAIAQFR